MPPSDPDWYTPSEGAKLGERLAYATFNYINHPSLLTATPTGELWSKPMGSLHPDSECIVKHFSQTILATDSAYPEIFQKTGLDKVPNLHHIKFMIGTRIVDRRAEGKTEETRSKERPAHEIVIQALPCDVNDKLIPHSDIGHTRGDVPGLRFQMDSGGWSDEPGDKLLPIIRDIFSDWHCVVEHFKATVIAATRREPMIHPLFSMDILGSGIRFRRAELRLFGSMMMGVGIRNGMLADITEDNRTWQERLPNGMWVDVGSL